MATNTFQESDSSRVIPGVGPVMLENLLRIDLGTIHNVLEWYPRHYLDASNPVEIGGLPTDQLVAVKGTIISSKQIRLRGKVSSIVEAVIGDPTGSLCLRWFNQPFILQKLVPGTEWICLGTLTAGKGGKAMLGPILQTKAGILPVYKQTSGVTSKNLRDYVRFCLENVQFDAKYELPGEILESEHLLSRQRALELIHLPEKMSDLDLARRSIGFREAFWFFSQVAAQRLLVQVDPAPVVKVEVSFLQKITQALPFTLTPGQKRSLWEIVQDLEKAHPMTRLLNGEVGSGKTAVAGMAAAVVKEAGYRSILLVPTAILALQHTESLTKLLAASGVKVACWTAKRKDSLLGADLIIGTHALLQEGVDLGNIGLVIVDEQHRFGVKQRRFLRERGAERVPHLLSMTATPIPRSLALALFSDLQMSVIPEKPTNRLPIETRIVHSTQRTVMHERIVTELALHHQVIVICPLIEDEDGNSSLESKTVVDEVARLRRENPEYGQIGILHGRMKEAEKQAIMNQMAAGEIAVLVATSVVEVGVDIPMATVIIIEGAEHFGLSQLHQFRGRVGRNSLPSFCFLCPSKRSGAIDRRLEVLVTYQNGFAIAEQDLALRGPGDLRGLTQSGLPEFKAVSLGDLGYLRHVKEVVDTYTLRHPEFLEGLDLPSLTRLE